MSASPTVGSCAISICQNPGQKQCQACQSISYCSSEHQKEDWKRHRRNCPQFVLRVNAELNRHFVATRKIRGGSIIFDESPLLYGPRVSAKSSTVPKPEIEQTYCLSCCKSIQGRGSVCSKCTWPLFCSLNCSKAKAHTGNECNYFTKKKIKYRQLILPNHVLYRGIMIFRAILQKPKLGDGSNDNNGTWSSLVDLQHQRSDSSGGCGIDSVLLTQLQSYFKMKDLNCDTSDWTRINGAIDVNAFSIERAEAEGDTPSEVTALFYKSSFFAHSCLPNCTWGIGYSPDFPMRIRASRNIEKDEILTIAYNPNWGSYGTFTRMEMILDTGGFQCKCTRCEDPTEGGTFMSSWKCSIPSCTGNLDPVFPATFRKARWECSSGCSSRLPSPMDGVIDLCRKTEEMQQELNGIVSTLGFLPLDITVSFIMEFIASYSGTLVHPNHWILQQASQAIVHIYGSQIKHLTPSQLKNFVQQCHYLLRLVKILSPGISLQRAVLELYLSRALFRQHENRDGDKETVERMQKLEFLQEIHGLQMDSLQYWKNDIQSKRSDKVLGYEEEQLNYEIITVLSEFEKVKKMK